MGISAKLGFKYFRSKKGFFVSFTSFMAIAGLTVGVATLIIVMSVMNGFERELQNRILGVIPHALIHSREPIDKYDELIEEILKVNQVEEAVPFIQMQSLISNGKESRGVLLTAVDPQYEKNVSILEDHMKTGSISNLQSGQIIIGFWLAAYLGVSVGDEISILTSEVRTSLLGSFPRSFTFKISGIFELKAEPDQNLVIISHDDGQKIKNYDNQTQSIRLKVSDVMQSRQIASETVFKISNANTSYASSTWEKTHGTLFQAVQLEKLIIGLLLFLIVGVAAFNILSTTVMSVKTKEKEIAIMKTIGIPDKTLVAIFIFQGLYISLIGISLGLILGLITTINLNSIILLIETMFDRTLLDAYFINYFPYYIDISQVVLIMLTAFSLCLLSAIWPAIRVSRFDPVKVLRDE